MMATLSMVFVWQFNHRLDWNLVHRWDWNLWTSSARTNDYHAASINNSSVDAPLLYILLLVYFRRTYLLFHNAHALNSASLGPMLGVNVKVEAASEKPCHWP